MTREEAAAKLTVHLHQCGMLMPKGWLEKNGEDSELQQAFQLAISALLDEEEILTHEEVERVLKGDGAP